MAEALRTTALLDGRRRWLTFRWVSMDTTVARTVDTSARPDRRPQPPTYRAFCRTRGDGTRQRVRTARDRGHRVIETGARSDEDLVDTLERLLPRERPRSRPRARLAGMAPRTTCSRDRLAHRSASGAGRRTNARIWQSVDASVSSPQPRQPAAQRAPELRPPALDHGPRPRAHVMAGARQGFGTRDSTRCRRWPFATGSIKPGPGLPDEDGGPRCSTRRRRRRFATAQTSTRPASAIPELRNAGSRRHPAKWSR